MTRDWKGLSKRWALRAVKTLGVLAVLLGCLHLEENWRGNRAWQAHVAAQKAKGVRYDPSLFAPPVVPESENFAKHPFIAARLAAWDAPVKPKTAVLPKAIQDLKPQPLEAWKSGQPVDLAALRALGLDAALEGAKGDLAVLAEAAKRPRCRLLDRYDDFNTVPGLLGFRGLGRLSALRAVVALREGRSEAALEDVLTQLSFCRHLQGEPQLLSQLLALALEGMVIQPLWEGVQGHAWTEVQLARLEAAMAELAPMSRLREAYDYERLAFGENLVHKGPEVLGFSLLFDEQETRVKRLLAKVAFPRGWFALNALHLDEWWLSTMGERLQGDVFHADVETQVSKRLEALVDRARYNPTYRLAGIFIPAMLSAAPRAAERASFLSQARLACALERYRLAHRTYPERLEALVPAFLAQVPRDSVEARAFVYARTEKGYRLYSLGLDGKDEGGRMEILDATRMGPDWVWAR